MRKLYLALSIVLTAAFAASASVLTPVKATNDYKPALQLSTTMQLTKDQVAKTDLKSSKLNPMASPTGTWTKVSTGLWIDDLICNIFSDIDAAQWEVDVYESQTTPGWYRVTPCNATSSIGAFWGADTNTLDICAVNPDKVYFESYTPYPSRLGMEFCSAVPEAGFNGYNGYGTLSDGIINIPAGSIAYTPGTGWYFFSGSIKLVLDASTYKDYTIEVEVPFCSTADDQYLRFTTGPDVATVKIMGLEGEYSMNANIAAVVASNGVDVTKYAGQTAVWGFDGPNTLNTLLYVTLDANGNVKESGRKYTFIVENDSDNWESIGQASFEESIISGFFTDIESMQLTCTVEKHKTIDNYFRLVNPYEGMTSITSKTCPGHNHYLYVNATDPMHVYIEPSVLGVNINSNLGDVAVMSWGYQYRESDEDIAEAEDLGIWGTLNTVDGTITIPKNPSNTISTTRLLLQNYNNGAFLSPANDKDFVITLPEDTFAGIEDLTVDSDNDSPVEYYNLQGIKINNPQQGQIYIKRQGSKASKTYVK